MKKICTISDIRRHFFAVANWVDPDNTCDVIYRGNPETPVKKIGIGWSCCSQNLEAAAAEGCDLFISHEGLFPKETWGPNSHAQDTPWGRRRSQALEKNGMACMRVHDTWDNFPVYGIRDAWRRFLELGDLVEELSYFRGDTFVPGNSLVLSRVEPQSFRSFASQLAEHCRTFPCFQGATVQGDLEANVCTVATGVGCHIPTWEMLQRGADVLIVTLDRALQNGVRLPLTEMDANIIAVEHGVAEMPGMQSMGLYLEKKFPGLETMFFCQEPPAETITGSGG